jgi:hypothetical protein
VRLNFLRRSFLLTVGISLLALSCDVRRKSQSEESPSEDVAAEKPKTVVRKSEAGKERSQKPIETATPTLAPSPTPPSSQVAYSEYLAKRSAAPQPIDATAMAKELFVEVANAWDGKRGIRSEDTETSIDGVAWTEWANNYTGALVDFSDIVLSFAQLGAQGSSAEENTFNLQLSFSERRLLVDKGVVQQGLLKDMQRNRVGMALTMRHSKPKQASELHGLRLPISDDIGNSLYVPGLANSSIVVMVPPQPRNSVRGALVCPRDYQLWEVTSGITVLRPTPYTLTKVGFAPDVILDTHTASGSGIGTAESMLQLTKGLVSIPKGMVFQAGEFPRATLAFNPKANETIPVHFLSEGVTEAMKTTQVTHNSLEHKSVSTVEAAIGVAKVRIGREFTIEVERKRFSVPPGDCYAIVKTWQVKHSFVKEALADEVLNYPTELTRNK